MSAIHEAMDKRLRGDEQKLHSKQSKHQKITLRTLATDLVRKTTGAHKRIGTISPVNPHSLSNIEEILAKKEEITKNHVERTIIINKVNVAILIITEHLYHNRHITHNNHSYIEHSNQT